MQCQTCGAIFPESWGNVRCEHTRPNHDYRAKKKTGPNSGKHTIEKRYNSASNLWSEIHQLLADRIESGEWDAQEIKSWHDNNWSQRIPAFGCNCQKHWETLSQKIDWTTAQSAYESLFVLHNRVSRDFASKPEITREQCDALYLQQPSLDDCAVAVTSLAPNRLDRQTECLNTWKRFGLSIVAIQSTHEIDQIYSDYPQLSNILPTYSGDTIPTIAEMVKVATQHHDRILLLNADIEIHGQQRILRDAIAGGTVIGVRHNYARYWWQSSQEQWGIDAFSFDVASANQLPDLPFRIGKPWWDYWLLDYFRNKPMEWIVEPLFFHRDHEATWSEKDWDDYGKVFASYHGRAYSRRDVAEFRRQFPHFSG
jgi:hypothetical protein